MSRTNGIPYCKLVRLLYKDIKPSTYIYGKVVSVGSSYMGFRVGYASPNPCMVAPSTQFDYALDIKFREKNLEKNVLIELIFPSKHKEIYVYPTHVWDEIRTRFVEPMSEGRAPKEVGALLFGPPGTGKTSMAKILGWIHGLETVEIQPQYVLSKWLGESEKRLQMLFMKAEEREPSMVLFDDAEWLARSRESITGGEDVSAYLSLMNILLNRIESWFRERRRIISIVTTNVSEEKIDPALRRSGRLGRPIFIPLPDFEAVRILLEEMGIDPDTSEEWARKIVNAGLPMSDAVSIAKDLLAGKEPKIEPMRGRGYTRLVPPSVDPNLKRWLEENFSLFCKSLENGGRLWIPLRSSVSVPLATLISSIVCKKAVVVLTDQRRFDEAITTSDNSGAVLVISYDYISPDIVKIIHITTRSPVIYCGSGRLNVEAFPLYVIGNENNIRVPVSIRPYIVKSLADFYGVEISKKDLTDVQNMRDQDYLRLIEMIGILREPLRNIRGKLFI